MNNNNGYYRMPTISDNKIVFISENDLWEVSLNGGKASRLTTSQGAISFPKFSPDGKWIAFSSTDEGSSDIYVMSSTGGPMKRLTYLGGDNRVRGWSLDGQFILFSSSAKTPGISRAFMLFKVNIIGGEVIQIPVGIAHHIHYHKDGFAVIGRFQDDNATWKRYKGGRAGNIIVDNVGKGDYHPLIDLNGNMVLPHFVKNRIIFLSDHEGVSNIYSVALDGSDLKKLTNHSDFYARFLSVFGEKIVYQAGGEIFLLDLSIDHPTSQKVSISLPSMRTQRARKFVNPSDFLEDFSISRDYSHLLTIIRGKTYHFGFWEGGINQLGQAQGVRYKNVIPLTDETIGLTSDESGEYKIEIYSLKNQSKQDDLDINIGVPYFAKASPDGSYIGISNNRCEIILVDIKNKTSKVITKDQYNPIFFFDWSPDSKWITYSLRVDEDLSSIFLYNIADEKEYQITPKEFEDFKPVFDPKGRYIYFISSREFNSAYDRQYFDHVFVKGSRICAISLNNQLDPPFILKPKILKPEFPFPMNKDVEKNNSVLNISIDLENIQRRITMLPVEEDIYLDIQASEDRLFYSTRPVLTISELFREPAPSVATLKAFKLENLESVVVEQKISSFTLGDDKKTLVIKVGKELKVLSTSHEQKPGLAGALEPESNHTKPSRKNGLIDLQRIKVLIEPSLEWKQMFKETWRLMREQYWEPSLKGINWENIFTKYEPLIAKITTREEFSDLIWEMIAETGTSHSYEIGGDYKKAPNYRQGYLGGDFQYDSETGGYVITKILEGDNWNPDISSPLDTPGTNIHEGDIILSINGVKVSSNMSIGELLANQAGQNINLVFKSKIANETKEVIIKTLASESELQYRDWVLHNKRLISTLSQGKLGYIHIPDMQIKGVNEFYRAFKGEITKEGLIVDVRFNRGGNTSQLFLRMLSSAQMRTGYVWTRHSKKLSPYFQYTTEGPIVAVTNEFAGSDGDIFSHNFKLLKIGPLIGKRTWGGVVGIWPKVQLVDGSIVTQPEYAFWFKDVEWGVENYGTDPDIEVEFFPQDYAKGTDPQLLKAVELALDNLNNLEIKKPTSTT
ncbi:MAG: S41 family peptidase [Candidatus Thorarchaeota archaeon]